MQTVWIINQYATCPSRGTACRHFMLARELVKQGYCVTIIAGSGHYFHHNRPENTGISNEEIIDGVRMIWLRTPRYTQTEQLKRGLGWIIFLFRLVFLQDKKNHKPDIILHSSPSLIPFLGSYFLSWRNSSKLFFEFRDVWPLTFTEIANYSRFHPVVFIQAWIEKMALKKSVACLSSMEFGSRRLEELGIGTEKFHWLPNGVEFEDFEISKENEKSATPPEPSWRTNKTTSKKFIFGYAGTHGHANALGTLVEAANYLKNEPVHIVFVGDGSERSKLQEQAKSLSLENITFLKRVPKHEIPSILESMDGLLISWHDSDIYRYGTSANKLAEYFAAGKPVVQAYSGAGDHVGKYKAGITVPAGDAKAVAEAMLAISTSGKTEIEKYSNNARKAARENFTFQSLANKLIKVLEKHQ